MVVSLVMVTADGKERDLPLKRPVSVLGRQTDCTVKLPGSGVSRHHCEVSITPAGVKVRDLGSSNGTFINRERVTEKVAAPGDLLAVGELVFVIRVDGNPDFIDAEEAFDEGAVPVGSATPAAAPPKAVAQAGRAPAGNTGAPKPLTKPKQDDDDSVVDFDFLDEDDDIKKQPKL